MQLVNIATIAIELFGAAYFLIAFAAHLYHCWNHPECLELKRFDRALEAAPQNPPRSGDFAPAVEPAAARPATPIAELIEIAGEVASIESALVEVAAVVEAWATPPLGERLDEQPSSPTPLPREKGTATPVTDWNRVVPFQRRTQRPDYSGMTSQQLRKLCGDRGIKWRSVKDGKHLSKLEMIAALVS